MAKTLFDLPLEAGRETLVVIPVPWEVTVSFRTGTALGPAAVLETSDQVDLYDKCYPEVWSKGISMLDIPEELERENSRLRPLAERIIAALEESEGSDAAGEIRDRVNQGCGAMVEWVRSRADGLLEEGKRPCVLGGDHSVALGLIQAVGAAGKNFGILQFDAHCDLRESYQGFAFSHASVMLNALKLPAVETIVQVGVRDYSLEEVKRAEKSRVSIFDARTLARRRFRGETWEKVCREILQRLPQRVYISFDVDGLDGSLCPSTGTPAPGGLGFEEALYLVDEVVSSGREIVAFDLCEVTPGVELADAYLGARLLYRLCCATLASA